MKQTVGRYAVSFQAERFYKGTLYHWMICGKQNPDELVWGHAPTRELAEKAAQSEAKDLSSGRTQGGRVASTSKSATHER